MSIPQHCFYVIIREKPTKRITDEYIKYRNTLSKRRRKVSELYAQLEKLFIKYPNLAKKKDFVQFARLISKKLSLKLDRDASRVREALQCWFAENWVKINPIFYSTYIEFSNSLQKSKTIEKISKSTETFKLPDDIFEKLDDFELFGM